VTDERSADVVVVGAGLAGVSAAAHLDTLGKRVVIVEARERLGGRLHSRAIDGAAFDLGGQWIGPTQHRVHGLARELELATFEQYHRGRKVIELDGEVSSYRGSIPSLSLVNLLQTELLIRRVDAMASRVPLDGPHRAQKAGAWDATTVEAFKRTIRGNRAGKLLFDAAVRTVFGAEPAELSLLHFLFYLHTAGGFRALVEIDGAAQQTRLVDGAQQLVERRVRRMRHAEVLLGSPVRAIEQHDSGVRVVADGVCVQARAAVVAVPPHLAAAIRFAPALPTDRSRLLQRWPMGATVKIMARFREASWRSRGFSGEAVSSGGPMSVVFDNSSSDGRVAVLLGFVVGRHARRWSNTPPADRRAAALAQFERLHGVKPAELLEFVEHDWSDEPWTGGCPVSSMPAGGWTSFAPHWRAPVGRVMWAGTETASHWNGYMEGALESAERAASEVVALLAADPEGL
jgi:monoamine oxidase